jgi:N-acyl-phosphatidylethanolamine-hydrolysing phospholipase D
LGKLECGIWWSEGLLCRVRLLCPTIKIHFLYLSFRSDTGYRTVPSSIPTTEDDYSAAYSHLPVCPAFSQIGEHRGPFDLGLIPIGAYEPRWMFSNVHASPKDAVNIFVDTKCKKALGMHWGTWVLTEEEVMAPPKELQEACNWKGIKGGREGFGVCDIGESTEFESGEAISK